MSVDTYETALTSENALELFKPYDVILDGTDNFPTRYLVNDACVLLRQAERLRQHLPVRRAGVGVRDRRTGRAIAACIPSRRRPGSCRAAPKAACSACCPGIIGTIQATEAIKLILGVGEPLDRPLPDLTTRCKMRFRELKLRKDPDCPVCGTHPTVTELIDYEQFCGVAPARRRQSHPASDATSRSRRRS